MAPKKQLKSPFALFVAKMKRIDPKVKSMPFQQVFTYCNPIYESLNPKIRKQFEELSTFVKTQDTKEWEINRRLDQIDVKNKSIISEDINSNTEEEDWDKCGNSVATAPEAMVGFKYSQREVQSKDQISSDSTSDQLDDDFDESILQSLQSMSDLPKKWFVLICFNVSVRTFEGQYYPIEIGLTKVSLEEGIQEFYTKLISNPLPNGYYGTAKEFSELYHQLPVIPTNDPRFETNYQKLFEEIYEFMDTSELTDGSPDNRKLVFCKTIDRNGCADRNQVIGCLEWFDRKINDGQKSLANDFRVFDLSELLFWMTTNYSQKVRPKSLCIDDLSKCKFDFIPEINCDFHLESDNKYCALGVTKRLAYLFFDSLFSSQMNIELDVKPKASHRPKPFKVNSTIEVMNFDSVLPLRPRPRYQPNNNYRIVGRIEDESTADRPNPRRVYTSGLGRGILRQNLNKSK